MDRKKWAWEKLRAGSMSGLQKRRRQGPCGPSHIICSFYIYYVPLPVDSLTLLSVHFLLILGPSLFSYSELLGASPDEKQIHPNVFLNPRSHRGLPWNFALGFAALMYLCGKDSGTSSRAQP